MSAGNRKRLVLRHSDLEVYQTGFQLARRIFKHSKKFPAEERYSLTDQMRRSSRSVCANLAEAWRKRRYEAAFVAKLSDSEAEAAETQFGSNLPSTATTWQRSTDARCGKNMTP